MILKERYDKELGGIIRLEQGFGHYFLTGDFYKESNINIKNLLEKPVVAHINATDKCNFDCEYCYAKTNKKREMGINEYKTCIDVLEKNGVFILYWSGGEPFCNPSLMELLSYANKKDMHSIILTNASMVTQNVAYELYKMKIAVQVGLNKIWHDDREKSISLQKTIEGYHLLKSAGVNVMCTIMVDHNTICLEKIVDFLLRNQIDLVRIGYMVTEGKRGTFDEVEKYVQYASKTMKELKKMLKGKIIAEFQDDPILYEDEMFSRRMLCCEGGTTEIYIDSDGSAYPCPLFKGNEELKGGNIFHESIEDIWNSVGFKKLRNIGFEECGCSNCNYVCGAWCRGLVYSYYHNLGKKSPFCLKKEGRKNDNFEI